MRSDQNRSDQIIVHQIRSDQIRSDQIRSDHSASDQIRSVYVPISLRSSICASLNFSVYSVLLSSTLIYKILFIFYLHFVPLSAKLKLVLVHCFIVSVNPVLTYCISSCQLYFSSLLSECLLFFTDLFEIVITNI